MARRHGAGWRPRASATCRACWSRPRCGRPRRAAEAALAAAGADHRAQWRSQGSLVPVADHPSFAPLIAHPGFQTMFGQLGFRGTRFSSGYVISKPPGGPALFWHQDWWGWRHPISREDRIAQVALFLYMTDTTRENGCLRLIPGSHRSPHPLHDLVDAHDPTLAEVRNPGGCRLRLAPGRGRRAGDGGRCRRGGRAADPRRPPQSLRPRAHQHHALVAPGLRGAAGLAQGPHLADLPAGGRGYGHAARPRAPPRHLARAPAQPGAAPHRHRPRPRRARAPGSARPGHSRPVSRLSPGRRGSARSWLRRCRYPSEPRP